MYPTFLQRYWGLGPAHRAAITAVCMVGAIFGGVLFGMFSGRIGRRRAMMLALAGAIMLIPAWAYAPSPAILIAGAFLMQFMVQGAWGIIPAYLSELSPDSVRGFLPGFAYQCGVLLAGSVAYVAAVFAQRMRYSTAMAVIAVVVFSFALLMAAIGREQRGIAFGRH